jgi:hypothetical protein
MPDTVDLDSTLLLMQHYLELHHKQTHEISEKSLSLPAVLVSSVVLARALKIS